MALKKREKTLAVVAAVLLLAVAVKFTLLGSGGTTGELRKRRDELSAEVERKATQIRLSDKLLPRLRQWQRRSLPSDREIARSRYQGWLRELVDEVELRDATIKPFKGIPNREIYWRLSFKISGRATPDQLTRLLHGFYSAGHLHKVRSLTINPIEKSDELDLAVSIEALSLPGADRKDELSKEQLDEPLDPLADYRKAIVDRNLFAAYKPPPVVSESGPPEPKEPGFDHARHTFVNGIVEDDGRAEVWLLVRTLGKDYELHEGDTFEIGPLTVTIVEIRPAQRDVTIELNGQRRLVALGEPLVAADEQP